MPIAGLSERERFPRLGKIHLGVRHPEKGYPMKTDYFVLPKDSPAYNDLIKLFGEKPKELRVMIPAEDEEIWASQYLKAYDLTHGLVCKGDGITATRLVDVKTQKWPSKDATATTMIDMPCPGTDCQDYKAKKCGEQMNLQVIIPEAPGLGVWQIDTGSKNSIININSCAKIIKMAFGRLSRIPLTLSLESVEVKNPENGKRQTVYVMNLRANVTLAELASSAKAIEKSLLLTSPEFEAQLIEQTERDIEELWGDGKPVDKTTGEIHPPPEWATKPPPEEAQPKIKQEAKAPPAVSTPATSTPEASAEETQGNGQDEPESLLETGHKIDPDWLRENLSLAQWGQAEVVRWMAGLLNYQGIGLAGKFQDIIDRLDKEQARFLIAEIDDRIKRLTSK